MELMQMQHDIKNNKFFKEKQLSKDSIESLLKKSFTKKVQKEISKNVHVTVIQNAMILNLLTDITNSYLGSKHAVLSSAPTIIILSQSKSSLKSDYSEENNIPKSSPSMKVEDSVLDSATSCGLKGISINEICHAFSADKDLLTKLNIPNDYIPTKIIALGYNKKTIISSGKNRLLSMSSMHTKA